FTAHHHEALIYRPKQAYDNATPNGNGIAAGALQRLGHLLGEPRYLQKAERTLQAFDSVVKRNPAACASLSEALREYLTPPTIVILRGDAEKLAHWRHEIAQHYYPHHCFFYLDASAQDLPKTLSRKFSNDVNAWICQGVTCSQSIDSLNGLMAQI
ncbi:MAG TPA: thioredoxin domain-containing protein, partial [Methylotenera sp.]|nr:thioredoxin domain-containing protein [Methylotenera sp.]